MKSFFSLTIILAAISITISCATKKKIVEAPIETPKITTPKIEVPQGNLVPFTRDLFFKLREAGIDIKRLKFYVDKNIVLNKISNTDNMEVDSDGKLVVKKGLAENTITIAPTTAGMVETIEADGVRVNFGRPNSTLKFINNAASPVNFTFLPDKVNKANGTNEVNYNGSTYKASSESGSGLGEIKLLIRQLDIELNNGKGTVEPGVGGRTTLF
jgi:hypothetical protein